MVQQSNTQMVSAASHAHNYLMVISEFSALPIKSFVMGWGVQLLSLPIALGELLLYRQAPDRLAL